MGHGFEQSRVNHEKCIFVNNDNKRKGTRPTAASRR